MQGAVVPHAGESNAPPATRPDVPVPRNPAFDCQRLVSAFLTYCDRADMDAYTWQALRLTSRGVRDVVDAWAPATTARLRGTHPVGAALDRPVAAAVVAVELVSIPFQAVGEALRVILSHPRATSIRRLSFSLSALGEAAGLLGPRVAALPALASLHLDVFRASDIVTHVDIGSFSSLTALELQGYGSATEESAELWQALATLPHLACLHLDFHNGVCIPSDFPTTAFTALTGFGHVAKTGQVDPAAQRRLNPLANAPWLTQLTSLELQPAPGCSIATVLAALSGSLALRRLSLAAYEPHQAFSGASFPSLESLSIVGKGRYAPRILPHVGDSLLADLLSASLPRLRDLTLVELEVTRDLNAPFDAPELPFPLLQRLTLDLNGLTAPTAGRGLPAYHAILCRLMPTVEDATFRHWDNLLTVLNAMWDMGDGGGAAPPPAWPLLRVLRLSGSVQPAHIMDALRAKAAHCPALREVWVDVRSGGWGPFIDVTERAGEAAASGCWPILRLVTIKCGDLTDSLYRCVWAAAGQDCGGQGRGRPGGGDPGGSERPCVHQAPQRAVQSQ